MAKIQNLDTLALKAKQSYKGRREAAVNSVNQHRPTGHTHFELSPQATEAGPRASITAVH